MRFRWFADSRSMWKREATKQVGLCFCGFCAIFNWILWMEMDVQSLHLIILSDLSTPLLWLVTTKREGMQPEKYVKAF